MRLGKSVTLGAILVATGLLFVAGPLSGVVKNKYRVSCKMERSHKIEAREGTDVCISESASGLECKNQGLVYYVPLWLKDKPDPCVKLNDKEDKSKWNYDHKPCETKSTGATAKVVQNYHQTGEDCCVITFENQDFKPCYEGYRLIKDFNGKEDFCVQFE